MVASWKNPLNEDLDEDTEKALAKVGIQQS
jgi:hypothetical protein